MSQRVTVTLVGLTLAFLCGGPAGPLAAPTARVEQLAHVTLSVRPLGAAAVDEDAGPMKLELSEEGNAEGELTVAWPDADSRMPLRLVARWAGGSIDGTHSVDLEAELTPGEGPTVKAQRRIEFEDSTTFTLFEVYRQEDVPLMLAIEAEPSTETRVRGAVSPGRPVRFELEIQRVEDGTGFSLETNRLESFVRESVSYYFRLGSEADSDSMRIELRPTRIVGEIVEVEVELAGKVPIGDSLQVVSRRERVLVSRGVPALFAVEFGEPSNGYRFFVTADF